MSQQQQIDLSKEVTITLPVYQWNGIVGCLRTGYGPGWTWDFTNPLIIAISQQLQPHMSAAPPHPLGVAQKPNGEDHERAAAA